MSDQSEPVTPVLFRVHRRPGTHGDDVTAVFPAEPAKYSGYDMTCYASIGQHGACSFGWYRETRPATPEEYADLKRELESAPYHYRLKVYRKIMQRHRQAFDAAQRAARQSLVDNPAGAPWTTA